MEGSFLTSEELADRWNLALKTLRQWRWNGRGPRYSKVNGQILYSVQHIEAFEISKERNNTTELPSKPIEFIKQDNQISKGSIKPASTSKKGGA